ncbi:MAG TPA: hypothetical protein PKX23_13275 [Verrucomicrobiota bacterium]|nr:hypothetical protein [Verrucomicrobiota bacterium]
MVELRVRRSPLDLRSGGGRSPHSHHRHPDGFGPGNPPLSLAREYAEPDEKPDPAAVTVEDIQDFRENTFGQMRDLAGGKITWEAWEQQQQAEKAKAAEEEILSDEDTFKTAFLLLLLSKLNLVSMAAAAGLAYKVCANA